MLLYCKIYSLLMVIKLNSIQALRAIAVVLVVYAHSVDASMSAVGTSMQSSFFHLGNWGAIGLDLFFIISGFVMTRIINPYLRSGDWMLFIRKRIVRIIPLYWSLSLIKGATMLSSGPIDVRSIAKTLLFFPLPNHMFAYPIIGVGWSLSYELYFYSLIALSLRLRFKRFFETLLILLVCLSVLGTRIIFANQLVIFLTSPLLIEFGMGVLCGILYDEYRQNSFWRVLAWGIFSFGLLWTIGCIFLDHDATSDAHFVGSNNVGAMQRVIWWGVPCSFLLLGFTLLERMYSVNVARFWITIGDASYSNYLLHFMLLTYLVSPVAKLQLLNADTFIIFFVVGCTALSIPFYQYIERPLTAWANRMFLPTISDRQTYSKSN